MTSHPGVFVVEGTIVENLPSTMFRVQVTNGKPEMTDQVILGHLAGKMRIHWIRLLPGDKVKCEINALDTSRGRIIAKIK